MGTSRRLQILRGVALWHALCPVPQPGSGLLRRATHVHPRAESPHMHDGMYTRQRLLQLMTTPRTQHASGYPATLPLRSEWELGFLCV